MRDFVVKILVKIRLYMPVVAIINRIKFVIQSHRMHKDGLEMLHRAYMAFDDMGVHAFLTYGVLLGAFRDHGFISYDPDVDLGILSMEVPANLHAKMEEYGFKLYRQNVLAGSGTVFEETYIYKKLHLDLFYYFREDNEFYSIIARHHETKEWKDANATDGFPCDRSYVPVCDLCRSDFLGINVYIPKDTDGWLRAIYSDSYMTPIKNWEAKDYKTRIIHTAERSYRKLCL